MDPQNSEQSFLTSSIDYIQRWYHTATQPPTFVEFEEPESLPNPTFPGAYPLESNSRSSSKYLEDHQSSHVPQQETSLPTDGSNEERAVASFFQGAREFNIGDRAQFVNIGEQKTVNNYSAIHGLDALKDFVSFDALHDSSAQDPERRCHPGTRETVLKQMTNWIDDPDSRERILWLHGPAGAGKSAIAQTICQSYSRDKIAATFFFFRSDSTRNNGNRLFPTLAWQLAKSMPGAKAAIARALKDDDDLPRKFIENQFEHLIARPLRVLDRVGSQSQGLTPIIVVDGVDECLEERLQQRLLKIIGNAVADACLPLRFLISSRPEAHIREVFRQFTHTTLSIDLANVDELHRDIQKYLEDEFSRIASEQQLDSSTWPGRRVIQDIVYKSSGQFVYASTIIRFVSDEYSSAISQLNIILGLRKSRGKSPFSELDALYIEILKQQRDQEFLNEFLAILVAHTDIAIHPSFHLPLSRDELLLLNVDEKELHRKLRGMHSLIKLDPTIVIHHRSFLDFLQEPTRSRQYHVTKRDGIRKYLELIVSSLVRYASKVIGEPDYYESKHFTPAFSSVVTYCNAGLGLPLRDLEEVLQPLLSIKDELLNLPHISSPWSHGPCTDCTGLYTINILLMHLAFVQATSNPIPLSSTDGNDIGDRGKHKGISAQTIIKKLYRVPGNLDDCFSSLISHLRNMKLEPSKSMTTIGLVHALLQYDYIEIAMKIRTVSDAQNLIDLISRLSNHKNSISCNIDLRRNAIQLAIEICGRTFILPRSLSLHEADIRFDETSKRYKGMYQGKMVEARFIRWRDITMIYEELLLLRLLSHNNIQPFLGIYVREIMPGIRESFAVFPRSENGSLRNWRRSTKPRAKEIQQCMLDIARAIQYIHSLGVVLNHLTEEDDIIMDVDLRAKVRASGICSHYISKLHYWQRESNVFRFGCAFYEIYFDIDVSHEDRMTFKRDLIINRPARPEIHDRVWQLIQQCCAEDPKQRPTMNEVVEEMESWK